MPRSLILGNGTMLATFDAHLQMRDLYFPYVGMEDHTAYGDVHKLGVWVEGRGFSWTDDGSWRFTIAYKDETLVSNCTMENDKLGLSVTIEDSVHPVKNVLLRHLIVRSMDDQRKMARFFFNHDFHIYGDKQKDTAFYEPYTNTVIHYRQKRYFLIGGETSDPTECKNIATVSAEQSILHSVEKVKSCGINAYSIGKAEYNGLEGTWKDAEDGVLANTTVDQGSVDSTIGIHCGVVPGQETTVDMWLCLGTSLEEVVQLHEWVLTETKPRVQRNAHNYWKSWVNKTRHLFGDLPDSVVRLFKRSLLTIRMHADNHGGIVAAADADIMAFNRDTYTYVWPRDGAFISMALDKAGYNEVTRRFFDFCCKAQTADGYMLQKYNPDGSYGSSWHPWFRDNQPQLPIQEDETALILVALWNHFQCCQDFEFLQEIYERFVKKAAQFLLEFREKDTGLPLPSYDPWEEQRGVFTYTTACTIAGLHAAAQMCSMLGHFSHADRYQSAADQMRQALLFHLYDDEQGTFLKKITRKNGQTIERDANPDMGITMVWKLGILGPEDPRILSCMGKLMDQLTVKSVIGGVARYKTDYYHSVVPPTPDIPGNPWIITTLWVAQWHIRMAKTKADLIKARTILEWTAQHASPSGMLPEQLHPITGQHLSVSPLTWSHAVFVETVLEYAEKERVL